MTKRYFELKNELIKSKKSSQIIEVLSEMSTQNERFVDKIVNQSEIDVLKTNLTDFGDFEISKS